jgi:hypothetical protein
MDDRQFPAGDERALIYQFDEWMDELNNEQKGKTKALIITGLGPREWSFYAKSFDLWIDRFDDLMRDKPKVPIKISYSEDPLWEYWQKYSKHSPTQNIVVNRTPLRGGNHHARYTKNHKKVL